MALLLQHRCGVIATDGHYGASNGQKYNLCTRDGVYYALQLYLQRVVIGTFVVPRQLHSYHDQVAVPRANLSLSVQNVASLIKCNPTF